MWKTGSVDSWRVRDFKTARNCQRHRSLKIDRPWKQSKRFRWIRPAQLEEIILFGTCQHTCRCGAEVKRGIGCQNRDIFPSWTWRADSNGRRQSTAQFMSPQARDSMGYSIDSGKRAEQSLPTTRPLPLPATMPNDGIPTVDNEGLVSGHGCLRNSLGQILTELGCREDPYDQCLLTPTGRNRGALPLDVDELIEGYDEYHRKFMPHMHTRFSCGRTLRIKDATAGTVIVGRRVWQRWIVQLHH